MAAKPRARLKDQETRIPRDEKGHPRFAAPAENLPMNTKMALTRAERKALGLWDGDFIRDAQGLKKITVLGTGRAKVVDEVVGAGDMTIDGKIYRLTPRFDAAAGTVFEFKVDR